MIRIKKILKLYVIFLLPLVINCFAENTPVLRSTGGLLSAIISVVPKNETKALDFLNKLKDKYYRDLPNADPNICPGVHFFECKFLGRLQDWLNHTWPIDAVDRLDWQKKVADIYSRKLDYKDYLQGDEKQDCISFEERWQRNIALEAQN